MITAANLTWNFKDQRLMDCKKRYSHHHRDDHGCERPELVGEGVINGPHIVRDPGDDTRCWSDIEPSKSGTSERLLKVN